MTAAARALLSPRERARADRFVYDHHRRRYTVAQAHLRRVLGNLIGDQPANIRFTFGEHGKAFLADGPVLSDWHVGNIPCSSGATAAIAIDRPDIAVEPLGYDPAGL